MNSEPVASLESLAALSISECGGSLVTFSGPR